MLNTQEHEELIKQFEKDLKASNDSFLFVPRALGKEPKDSWKRGHIYANMTVNTAFLVYRCGYAFGKAKWRT
jgi:hypothetical protein